ncbi:MAG: histidine--tRNA ligase [bacterium]
MRAVTGVKDILPEEIWKWRFIEEVSRKTLEEYGFAEIRVPLFEYTELFLRSIGQTSDIVEKEMYTFEDSKGVNISLRPEGTAGVVRACIEHNLISAPSMEKFYYMGAMFRHERPQKGRYRQFFQIGAEAFGSEGPQVDAEIISMLHLLMDRLGIRDTVIEINSLGCSACRPEYRKALKDFLGTKLDLLCSDCRRRYEVNPLRVLDCKNPACKDAAVNAPQGMTCLCGSCMTHFESVKEFLTELGVPFKFNGRLVRGLDYYTRTTFEITTDKLGAQNAVAAGGRYDGLVEDLGGTSIPGIGFALGMERMAALLPEEMQRPNRIDIYLAPLGAEARRRALLLLHGLRSRGIRAESEYQERSLKSQMRQADKIGAAFAGILGENELARGVLLLRDMQSKVQTEVPLDQAVEKVWEQILKVHT